MLFEWDERKRRANFRTHKLDFRDAPEVFDGPTVTYEDDRFHYGEQRLVTIGASQKHSRFHCPYRRTGINPYYLF
jgi:uncharacterized DUF497 family protein